VRPAGGVEWRAAVVSGGVEWRVAVAPQRRVARCGGAV